MSRHLKDLTTARRSDVGGKRLAGHENYRPMTLKVSRMSSGVDNRLILAVYEF